VGVDFPRELRRAAIVRDATADAGLVRIGDLVLIPRSEHHEMFGQQARQPGQCARAGEETQCQPDLGIRGLAGGPGMGIPGVLVAVDEHQTRCAGSARGDERSE